MVIGRFDHDTECHEMNVVVMNNERSEKAKSICLLRDWIEIGRHLCIVYCSYKLHLFSLDVNVASSASRCHQWQWRPAWQCDSRNPTYRTVWGVIIWTVFCSSVKTDFVSKVSWGGLNSGDAIDLYLADLWFESSSGQRLYWRVQWCYSVSPDKCLDSTSITIRTLPNNSHFIIHHSSYRRRYVIG